MERVKVQGLTVGSIGLASLFLVLLLAVSSISNSENYTSFLAISAILLGVALTLGATAMVFFKEKRGAYFMASSTTIGAIGFFLLIQHFYELGIKYQLTALTIITIITITPMLASTILLSIPTKTTERPS